MELTAIEQTGVVAVVVEEEIRLERVSFKYPRVEGLPDPEVEREVNWQVSALVDRMIREAQGDEPERTNVDGSYRVTVNENGVLSIRFEVYFYHEGAAHPMDVVRALTFDLLTEKVYRLGELFLPGSDYKRRINSIVRQEMEEKEVPLLKEFVSIGPDQEYYLTGRAIMVFFQIYEYTPYAYGLPEFEVPYRDLRTAIDPQGPLGRLFDVEKPAYIIRPERPRLNLRYRL